MICKPCAEASANNVHGEDGHREYGCPALNGRGYSWCDCMHREGPIEQHIQPDTVKRMVEDGLVHPDRMPNPKG